MDSAEPAVPGRLISFLGLLLLLGLAAIQFIRPRLEHPHITGDLEAPPEVKQILRNSCYNCHSNETKLPWFDNIAPAYWIVVHDVNQARKHLNFSEIEKLPPAQEKAALYEAINMIQLGAMPLRSYALLHPNAAVTPDQLDTLKAWLNPPGRHASSPDPAQKAAADDQYNQWLHSKSTPTPSAPNGIAYNPDWKNWRVLSTTDRFDNKTLRVIYGNDTAMKAIAEHRTNPWPDGTAFAKAAWFKQPDENGDTKAGAFFQVEFMIKDAQQYASTQGWGWARWRGLELKPYGKDPTFTSECTGCHAPLKRNDYVYTFPLEGQQ